MSAETATSPTKAAAGQELARPDASTLVVRFGGAFALGLALPGLEELRGALEAEPRPARLVFRRYGSHPLGQPLPGPLPEDHGPGPGRRG